MPRQNTATHASLERVARDSYGRLVGWLAWKCGDLAAAEDAMSIALSKALTHWPQQGLPDQPESWLLTVAKRELLQKLRHDKLRSDPGLVHLFEDETADVAPKIPDTRLRLMAVCCHPAIDEKIRMPLMLQCVLGVKAEKIAPAMLMSPSVLAQRLVRAKQKIKACGIHFGDADTDELPERLQHIHEAIYALFSLSHQAFDGADRCANEWESEALFLSELVCKLAPQNPESTGLWALLLFVKARHAARSLDAQDFAPLAEQDTRLWDRLMIQRADQALLQASQMRQPGPYQLEAAIQSAHCQRLFSGKTPWKAIAALYGQLVAHFPTAGAVVGYAVALGESGSPGAGLKQLDSIGADLSVQFQPWWVARGHLLMLADGEANTAQARAAFQTALGLTIEPQLRGYLLKRIASIESVRSF